MNAFQVIHLLDPDVAPHETKVHLATWNGREDPLDVYLRGEFEEWQATQTKENFQRPHVLSLIAFRGTDRWLFAGLHDVHGCVEVGGRAPYRYTTAERPGAQALGGRLVIRFPRPGRQSYLLAERWVDQFDLHEIRAERLTLADFPGYRKVNISHADLRVIVGQGLPSWKAALSNVAGIYLIADSETGRLYVGSACGGAGLWSRWCQYAESGHGGNVELKELLQDGIETRPDAFRYSILETLDLHAGQADVIDREVHWKHVLLSRTHGLNAN